MNFCDNSCQSWLLKRWVIDSNGKQRYYDYDNIAPIMNSSSVIIVSSHLSWKLTMTDNITVSIIYLQTEASGGQAPERQNYKTIFWFYFTAEQLYSSVHKRTLTQLFYSSFCNNLYLFFSKYSHQPHDIMIHEITFSDATINYHYELF